MIKIFLVEDEIIIRRGIKNSIDWEKEGYEFSGEASDGELALPMIKKRHPDILITDIKMPFMDGLELSRLVKKVLPDIKILILSGYNEFEYAKQAIKIGVTDYLLKPISSERLLEVLGNVRKQIQQEKDLVKRYNRDMQENLEQEKLKFLNQLLQGQLSVGEALEEAGKFDIGLSAERYRFLLFKILNNREQTLAYGEIVEAFNRIEMAVREIKDVTLFQRGIQGWVFLISGDSDGGIQKRSEELKEVLEETMRKFPEIEYFGGMGEAVLRIRDFKKAFISADKAFANRFICSSNQIIMSAEQEKLQDSMQFTELVNVENGRKVLERFLCNGTPEEIDSFLETYFQEISEKNLKSTLMRQYIIMDFFVSASVFCENKSISGNSLHAAAERLKLSLQKADSLPKIKGLISELLNSIFEARDMVSGYRYSDMIQEAKRYIQEHYMSEDVSLNAVSAKVNMSPSYFSSIFSKEVGKTFVMYLTEVRMEKAKELLMCSSMKTSEIGFEVGYKDSHYFSYIFKKTQNCTPKEYRQRGKAAKE